MLIISILLMLISCLVVFFLYRRGNSICLILPIVYISVCAYGIISLVVFDFGKDVPFDLFSGLSMDSVEEALYAFSLSSMSWLIGCSIISIFCKKMLTTRESTLLYKIRFNINKVPSLIYVFSAFFSVIVLILAIGPNQFIYKQGYHIQNPIRQLMVVYSLFLPLSALCCAFIKGKLIRRVSFMLLLMAPFAISSRTMLIVIAFYFIGSEIMRSSGGGKKVLFLALLVFCAAIPLEVRNNAEQGLLGNSKYIFTNGVNLDFLVLGLNYVMTFSIGVLSFMIENINYETKSFLIAVNPLPSRFVDIGYVISNSKINAYAPFNAVGEVYMMGWKYTLAVYVFLGVIIAYFERVSKSSLLLNSILVCFILLVSLLSIQYNLRGAARIIYYLIVIFSAYSFLRFASHSNKRHYYE